MRGPDNSFFKSLLTHKILHPDASLGPALLLLPHRIIGPASMASKNTSKKRHESKKEEGLDVLLGRMHDCMGDAGLLRECFLTLSERFHASLATFSEIHVKKIIKVIVQAMHAHPTGQPALCTTACMLVHKLCRDNKTRQEWFIKEHGVEAVVEIMRNAANEAELQWCATKSLELMPYLPAMLPSKTLEMLTQAVIDAINRHQVSINEVAVDGVDVLMRLGGHLEGSMAEKAIGTVTACMGAPRWVTCVRLQPIACVALWTLAVAKERVETSPEFCVRYVEALWKNNALNMILSAMELLLRDAERAEINGFFEVSHVLQKACHVIATMYDLSNGPPQQTDLTVILCVMKKYMFCPPIHFEGIRALGMAFSTWNETVKVEGELAVNVMTSVIQTYKQDTNLTHRVFCVLCTMIGSPKGDTYCDDIVKPLLMDSCLQTLLENMIMHIRDEPLQGAAVQLFAHLSKKDASTKQILANSGCMQAMVRSMCTHMDSEGPIADLVSTMFVLLGKSSLPDAKAQMYKDGTAEMIMDAVVKHADNSQLVQYGFTCLHTLISEHTENITAIETRVMELACMVILRHPEDIQVLFLACVCTFTTLSRNSDGGKVALFQTAFAQMDGIKQLARVLKTCETQSESPMWTHILSICLGCVTHATKHHAQNQECCMKQGIQHSILRLMDIHKDNAQVQMTTFFALHEICNKSIAAQEMTFTQENWTRARHAYHIQQEGSEKKKMLHMLQVWSLHASACESVLRDDGCPIPHDCLSSHCHVYGIGQPSSHDAYHQRGENSGTQQAVGGHSVNRKNQDKNNETQTQTRTLIDDSFFDKPHSKTSSHSHSDTFSMSQFETGLIQRDSDSKEIKNAKRLEQACVTCGRTAEELGIERLLKCSACTIRPPYCSAECQRSDWAVHKAECRMNKRSMVKAK
jgi:hypothetical protein